MELDLYDELMELYSKNKGVKEVKNWEELELGTRKWYNTDFKKFHVVGDGIKAKSEIPLESLHSSEDFCFGIRDNILFYRTCLLFRGSAIANVNKFYRVNYSNFDSIDVTNRYWEKKEGFKGSPIILDDTRKVFNDINQLLQERFNILGKSKKTAQKGEEVNRDEELEKPNTLEVESDRLSKKEKQFFKPIEVSTIVRPRPNSDRFEDLLGNYVAMGSTSFYLKKYCRGHGYFLGLKRTNNSQRWVLIRSEDVNPYLNDEQFLNDHMCEYAKGKIRLERLKKEKEIERKNKLKNSIENILNKLDQDGNGVLDIIEGNDYMKLLKKHQRQIKEIDRNYIQRFIQVSNFLKSQSETLQEMFTRIQKVRNQQELESLVGLLKNHIHTYEQILFHSLNMIVSLVEEDDLTFHEIYISFDKLHIFDSAWEKQVSQQLSDINLNIIDLMSSVDSMNADILNGLSELSYITEESNRNLVNQLGEIDSSIKVNNFLSGIQTYQLYKINKNTRSLRS